jgi:hypothetical protein
MLPGRISGQGAAANPAGKDCDVAGPSWLVGLLAAVMIATAVYCASRLAAAWRRRRPTGYDVDVAHVLMGAAMAGMLVPRAPGALSASPAGERCDAVHLRLRRRVGRGRARGAHGRPVHAGRAMGGGILAGRAGFPSLTLGLALALFASMIWAVDRVLASPTPVAVASAGNPATPEWGPAAPGRNPATSPGLPMSPRLAACCEIVMGVTMSYMLITML